MTTKTISAKAVWLGAMFVTTLAAAQGTPSISDSAVVMGTVKNAIFKEIQLEINRYHINNTVMQFRADLVGDKFYFKIPIQTAQLIRIKYLRNTGTVYIEPNDTLEIHTTADQFQYAFEFGGKSAGNNRFWVHYNAKFPEERSPFKIMQYRKNMVWYKADREWDSRMRTMDGPTFSATAAADRQAKTDWLNAYEADSGAVLSEQFRYFMWCDINYGWAYQMLTYGYAFGGKHRIDNNTFFDFMNEVALQNDFALGNEKYRDFVVGAVNFISERDNKEGEHPIVHQYLWANEHLKAEPRAFVQANILSVGFQREQMPYILDIYQDFLTNSPYPDYADGATAAYQAANRYAVGSAVPPFSLRAPNGTTADLASLRGKVVMLNFWASWCRPCVSKMEALTAVQAELEGKNVVFVHISFDKDAALWEQTIAQYGFKGLHFTAPEGVAATVAKTFSVNALPEFFIIDPKGFFAEKPRRYDVPLIREQLLKMCDK